MHPRFLFSIDGKWQIIGDNLEQPQIPFNDLQYSILNLDQYCSLSFIIMHEADIIWRKFALKSIAWFSITKIRPSKSLTQVSPLFLTWPTRRIETSSCCCCCFKFSEEDAQTICFTDHDINNLEAAWQI